MEWDHAVVLGGGYTGLLVTNLLAQYFTKVTLVDKDDLFNVNCRQGIPQADHLHVLMKKGQQLIEMLMPGILSEITERVATSINWTMDTKWYGPFGCYPQYHSDISTLSFSRRLLDEIMIKRVIYLENVTIVKCFVRRLVEHNGSIDTVILDDDSNKNIILHGSLIIDTRGKSANTSRLLKDLYYHTLSPLMVNNELTYASRLYANFNKIKLSFKQIYVQVSPGSVSKGIVITPIEDHQMMVTAISLDKTIIPRNENEFDEYVSQLPCIEIKEILKTIKPHGSVIMYRNLKNVHRQYGRMKRWPHRFIVMGDAACVLNPVYGQGMTLATKQVIELKAMLDNIRNKDKLSWEHQFQKKIDKIFRLPWLMATTEDRRAIAAEDLSIFTRFLHLYLNALMRLSVRDREIHKRFIKIIHMVDSPLNLFHPLIFIKAVFSRKR